MKVPFLDLKTQYLSIQQEIQDAIGQVLESTAFAGGPFVAKFEDEFAAYCNCKYAVGVGNGTDALWFALLALGVKEGDEVITVPNTFIATAEAISFCGARPVFVDVDERTHTLNPDLLEAAITPRTKAIIPVHLFGQTADMDPILGIAQKHRLYVIEDACQAHGAEYKGRKAGSIGHAGCFSFYPGKNLGAYGEAGAVVTNDPGLADRMRVLRDHGQPKKYYHDVIGWNGRMDGIQGAVLSVKLKHLDRWNESRRSHAAAYGTLLGGTEGLILPQAGHDRKHVYHLYAVRVQNRDRVMAGLAEKGISCGIHYPIPIHLQKAYGFMQAEPGQLPVAEKSAAEFVSLPMYPELTPQQVDYVACEIRGLLA